MSARNFVKTTSPLNNVLPIPCMVFCLHYVAFTAHSAVKSIRFHCIMWFFKLGNFGLCCLHYFLICFVFRACLNVMTYMSFEFIQLYLQFFESFERKSFIARHIQSEVDLDFILKFCSCSLQIHLPLRIVHGFSLFKIAHRHFWLIEWAVDWTSCCV
jgi:hypothetical protein